MRSLYLIGFLYLSVSGLALWQGPRGVDHSAPLTAVNVGSDAGKWFQAVKPFCNSLEIETAHRRLPPPQTLEGAGFSAACYALAANLSRARSIIMSLPPDDRWRAAGLVFDIGHPIADLGDDRSAGPMMELVVEFWPNHYQALYHAGASNYTLGKREQARIYLREFLSHYHVDDGFTRNARAMLAELDLP